MNNHNNHNHKPFGSDLSCEIREGLSLCVGLLFGILLGLAIYGWLLPSCGGY